MISIIICSVNKTLLAQLKNNIAETIGVEYEVIAIDNTNNEHSIASAYNLGASRATYHYLCFIHEDILFHTPNWGILLINHLKSLDISLIGVLGNVIKTLAPSGAFTFNVKTTRINHLQRVTDNSTEHYFINPYNEYESEVKVLDGLFLAVSKANYLKYPFDEELITGFHGYDVDFSLGQLKNGKVIVIYDVLLEHFSFGNINKDWIDVQLQITNKWKKDLPACDINNARHLKEVETKNTVQLLLFLFQFNYKKRIQLIYLFKIFLLTPFNRLNFYLLRKALIYGRPEMFIKRLYKIID